MEPAHGFNAKNDNWNEPPFQLLKFAQNFPYQSKFDKLNVCLFTLSDIADILLSSAFFADGTSDKGKGELVFPLGEKDQVAPLIE